MTVYSTGMHVFGEQSQRIFSVAVWDLPAHCPAPTVTDGMPRAWLLWDHKKRDQWWAKMKELLSMGGGTCQISYELDEKTIKKKKNTESLQKIVFMSE